MEKRIIEIDIAKGLGIILMLMGHIGFGERFDIWVHGFHMPLFYVLSGVLCNKDESFFSTGLKKAKRLLLPYVLWAIFYVIVQTATIDHSFGFVPYYIKCLVLYPTIGQVPINGGIWFLVALFWIYLFWRLITCFSRNGVIRFLICIISGLGGMILTTYMNIWLPFGIDAALVGLLFFSIGYFSRTKIYELRNASPWNHLLLLGVVVPIVSFLIMYNGPVGFREGIYSNIFLTCVNAIGGIIGVFSFACIMKRFHVIASVLRRIGEHSIVFVCTNQLLIRGIKKVMDYYQIESVFFVKEITILLMVLVFEGLIINAYKYLHNEILHFKEI